MHLMRTEIRQRCADGLHRLGAFVAARSLPIILWVLWTVAVGLIAGVQWRADRLAHHPLNVLAVIIHCAVAGVIELVVLTWLDLRLEPWRWTDDEHDTRE